MLVSRRDFAIACTTGSALAMLAACSNSHGRGDTQPSASALPSNQQEGVSHQGTWAPSSPHPSPVDSGNTGHVSAPSSGNRWRIARRRSR